MNTIKLKAFIEMAQRLSSEDIVLLEEAEYNGLSLLPLIVEARDLEDEQDKNSWIQDVLVEVSTPIV